MTRTPPSVAPLDANMAEPGVLPFEPRQFHLHSCLGRGGFGEVYRATMITGSGRTASGVTAGGVRTEVAVKVMHADVDPESQAVQRLRDEGRLLGAVRHPAVLRVYDLVLLGVSSGNGEKEGRV